MKSIWIYIYLFFLLFGPKLWTYVDTSILANFIAFYFIGGHKFKIDSHVLLLLMWFVFLILCYMGVAIYYETIDVVFVGRLVRSMCSFVCIYALCCHYSNVHIETKIDWIINILLLHAVIVIISALFFVDLQEYLRVINDFATHVRKYRSTGLMAGYDISGLICNIGVILVLVKTKFNAVKFFIFVVAALLTSRFSMISLSMILLFYFLSYRKGDSVLKSFCVVVPLIVAGGLGIIILSLTSSGLLPKGLISSLNFSSNFLDTLIWTYANSDFKQTTERYFFFPETFLSLLFGAGSYVGTDPGYVRMINCIGILGLLSVMLWHAYLFYIFFSTRQSRYFRKEKSQFIGFTLIAVLVFLNFKNSYFFTGTFFEIMIFILFSYIFESDRYKVETQYRG